MAAPCVIGVDLGGTKLLAGAVDANMTVHHRAHRVSRGESQADLLDTCVEAVEEVRSAVEGEVAAVGFGIPCLIDQERGMAVMAVNLPIVDVPFRDIMAERLGLPVFIDNDANVAALVEQRHGVAKGATEVVMLTLGTGIGGGLVLRGELYRGAVGAAAELGHMVVKADGPRCQGNCPNYGCLEAMASGTAIAREGLRAAEEQPDSALGEALAAGREITGALVTELAHDGDAAARDVLADIGFWLGIGITNYVNIFNPQYVVLGGGALAAGDLVLEPARRVLAERGLRPSRDIAQIVPARFGTEAGMLGAAALAFDAIGSEAASV
jgi:glucokinase